jgi:hypothetical protein
MEAVEARLWGRAPDARAAFVAREHLDIQPIEEK